MYRERNYFEYRERKKRLLKRRAAMEGTFRTLVFTVVLCTAVLAVSLGLSAYDRLAGTGRTPVATAAEPARVFRLLPPKPTETPQNLPGIAERDYPTSETRGLKQTENWLVWETEMKYTKAAATYAETEATYRETELPYAETVADATLASIGVFGITAYCTCVVCTGIWSAYHPGNIGNPYFVQRTASGTVPQAGRTAAVDADMIPLGTEIYIYGIGWRTAEDTGSAVVGYVVDLFKDCHDAALGFGRQNREVFAWR